MAKKEQQLELNFNDNEIKTTSWAEFNSALMQMTTEQEVARVLEHERNTKARLRFMLRAYNRFSKLRSQREKVELAKHAKA